MITKKRLPQPLELLLGCLQSIGYSDAIIAGPYLRRFLLCSSSFDPTGAADIYLTNSSSIAVKSFALDRSPTENLKTLNRIIEATFSSCLVTHHSIPANATDNDCSQTYPPYKIQFKTNIQGVKDNSLIIVRILDKDPMDHVAKFVFPLNHCVFDGRRYRLFQGFIDDRKNKTISITRKDYLKNPTLIEKLINIMKLSLSNDGKYRKNIVV